MKTANLAALNAGVHDGLLDLWTNAMEAAMGLRWPESLGHWEAFVRALAAHAAFEDRSVLPLYEAGGVFPRGGAMAIMEAEHERLTELSLDGFRTLKALAQAQDDGHNDNDNDNVSAGSTGRRALIGELDDLLRVKHVLDHHTIRECELVYPTLQAQLKPDKAARLGMMLEMAAKAASLGAGPSVYGAGSSG